MLNLVAFGGFQLSISLLFTEQMPKLIRHDIIEAAYKLKQTRLVFF